MSDTTKESLTNEEVQALLQKAERGDHSVTLQLRSWLEQHPEVWKKTGDLAEHALMSLLDLCAGKNLLARESVKLDIAELEKGLLKASDSPLEKLLVRRIALCWLATNIFEMRAAENERKGFPSDRDFIKRQDAANRRFLASVKALAQIRKLLPRTPSPLDLLQPMSDRASSDPSEPRPFRKKPADCTVMG